MASSEENDEMMECEENEDVEEDISGDGAVEFHPPEEESVTVDESAYIMYHEANAGAPCLSFDVIPDMLGERREDFPMTCYAAAGTQAARGSRNYIVVMKMSNLHKTTGKRDGDDEEDDEDEEESDDDDDDESGEDRKPKMEMAAISHVGGVNRIRCTVVQDSGYLAATWSDMGKVNIFNLQSALAAVNDAETMKEYDYEKRQDTSPPLFSRDLAAEGFALDWSSLAPGTLVVGNCAKHLEVFTPHQGGSWQSQGPYLGHTASVEDIQWSPTESNVFASCAVDQSIRIWDNRVAGKKGCRITVKEAHLNDVNVIHWNKVESHFLISGGDDNAIKVWDLRQIMKGTPIGTFSFHKAAITSVEWNPNDGAVFAASGEDDVVTLWDLSLEKDDQAGTADSEVDVPQQLLFTHHGQHEVKELHWHPQLPGVIISTAHSGINIFKTIST